MGLGAEGYNGDEVYKDRTGYRTKGDYIKGYIFYIETMGEEPILFMMRHTAMEFGETMAKIVEVPKELLSKAVEENKDRHYFGMYPINNAVKVWLKKELGVK